MMEKKKIVAIPLVEVAGIKFGWSRNKVRETLGSAEEFKKSKFSKNTTDNFGFCHVFYDEDNKFEAIELFEECSVFVNEQLVFPTSVHDAESVLGKMEYDGYSYLNANNAIGITAPDGRMESILFGKKGYYSK